MFSTIRNAFSFKSATSAGNATASKALEKTPSTAGSSRDLRSKGAAGPAGSAATRPASEPPPRAPLLRSRNCRDLTKVGRRQAENARENMGQFQAHVLRRSEWRILEKLAGEVCHSLCGRKMSDAGMRWALREAATPHARRIDGGLHSEGGTNPVAVIAMLSVMIDTKTGRGAHPLTLEDVAGLHLAITKEIRDPDLQKRCLNLLSEKGGWTTPGATAPLKSRLLTAVEHYLKDSQAWPHSAMAALESVSWMQGDSIKHEDLAATFAALNAHHLKSGGEPGKEPQTAADVKTVLAVILKAYMPTRRGQDVTLDGHNTLIALVQDHIQDPKLAAECADMIASRTAALIPGYPAGLVVPLGQAGAGEAVQLEAAQGGAPASTLGPLPSSFTPARSDPLQG